MANVSISDLYTDNPLTAVADPDLVIWPVSDLSEATPAEQAKGVNLTFLDDRFGGSGASLTIDTAANIIASSPSSPSMAFSTDTNLFYVWDGSNWYVSDSVWSLVAAGLAGQWDFSDDEQSGHLLTF